MNRRVPESPEASSPEFVSFTETYGESLNTDPLGTIEGLIDELLTEQERVAKFVWIFQRLGEHKELWKGLYAQLSGQKIAAMIFMIKHGNIVRSVIAFWERVQTTPESIEETEVEKFLHEIKLLLPVLARRFGIELVLQRDLLTSE